MKLNYNFKTRNMERESKIYYANVDKILNTSSDEFYSLIDLIKNDNRIFICLPDKVSPKLFARCIQVYHPELKIAYGTDQEITYNMLTQLIYVNSKHLASKLFYYYSNQRKIDFADVIFITDNNLENYHNLLTISFLLYANNKVVYTPKTILDFAMKTESQNDNDLGATLRQHQTTLVYGYKENMFEKIGQVIKYERFTNLVIHAPDHLIAKHLMVNISATFPNLLAVIVDNNSDIEILRQILIERIKVIIAVDIEVLPLVKIDIVIDLMRKINRNITVQKEISLSNYGLSGKKSAERHINYINANKCYRFIGKNTYSRLKDVPLKKLGLSTKFLDKYLHLIVISLCQNDVNPETALNLILSCGRYESNYFNSLQNKIKTDVEEIFKLGLVNKTANALNATIPGVFVKTISLNYRHSYFLYQRIFTEHSIYPAVVLATFLHYHQRSDREYLLTQLNSWNNLAEYLGDLHEYFIINYHIINNKNIIVRWANDNNISIVYLDKQLRQVNRIYLLVKNNYHVKNTEIKVFESNDILKYAGIL